MCRRRRSISPAPPAPPAPAYADAALYRYIDDADALLDTVGASPPDYGFRYDGIDCWAWELNGGDRVLAEPVDNHYRFYAFAPGDAFPFFVGERRLFVRLCRSRTGSRVRQRRATDRLASPSDAIAGGGAWLAERGRAMRVASARRAPVSASDWASELYLFQRHRIALRRLAPRRRAGRAIASESGSRHRRDWRARLGNENSDRRDRADRFDRWRRDGYRGDAAAEQWRLEHGYPAGDRAGRLERAGAPGRARDSRAPRQQPPRMDPQRDGGGQGGDLPGRGPRRGPTPRRSRPGSRVDAFSRARQSATPAARRHWPGCPAAAVDPNEPLPPPPLCRRLRRRQRPGCDRIDQRGAELARTPRRMSCLMSRPRRSLLRRPPVSRREARPRTDSPPLPPVELRPAPPRPHRLRRPASSAARARAESMSRLHLRR